MNLSNREELILFLRKFRLDPKKGLGQHFLCDAKVTSAIVNEVTGFKGGLEIGPGPGILTAPLSTVISQIIAIEIDYEVLKALAFIAPSIEVVKGDALKLDWSDYLVKLPTPRALVSNMPYFITGSLIQKVAENRGFFDKAVLMMQKEVADRVSAPPKSGDRGSLSVYLQALFEINKVCDVNPNCFLPPPKVYSTVLSLVPKKFEGDMKVFDFIRLCFAQPRKTLANNLMQKLKLTREEVTNLVKKCEFEPTIRAHDLTFEEWNRLFLATNKS